MEPLPQLDARACPQHGVVQVGPVTLEAIRARKEELAHFTHVPVRGALVELRPEAECPQCGSRSLCRKHGYAERRWYETVLLGEEFFPGAGRLTEVSG
ncbi:MAG TPA: hypothetical protein VNZ52_12805 [Candidatus Thermoplasmatota archaeon]|nr:hypothetical protein [Candidatus Thermoplasmatota archaeon]